MLYYTIAFRGLLLSLASNCDQSGWVFSDLMAGLQWWSGWWPVACMGLQLLQLHWCLLMFTSPDVWMLLWTAPCVSGRVPSTVTHIHVLSHTPVLEVYSLCASMHRPVPVLVYWQSPGRVWLSHPQSRTWRLEQAVLWESWRRCYHSGSFNSNSFSLLDNQQRPRVCALTCLCCRGRVISTVCSHKGERDIVIMRSSAKIWHYVVYTSFDLVLLMHTY